MDVIKKVKITKHKLGILGYKVIISPGGYQVLYSDETIEQWTNPGNFTSVSNGSSDMKEFYESMAWEKVKKHYRENSGIATLTVGDEFEVWDNKVFKVESIEREMLHCVMIKPVAPAGAVVTRKFKIDDLTVAVDIDLQEVASAGTNSSE